MTMRNSNYFMLGMVSIGCFVVGAQARADTPLSLTASENLTYDSNILRTNDNKYSDTVSATGVQLGFDKQYGRQTYKASGTVVATRYKNSDFYNNDGYNLSLGFTSQISSNWFVSLDHNRVKQLQSFQEQGLTRYKEPINSHQTDLFLQYGLFGRWSLNADVDQTDVNYEVLSNNDRSSTSTKLGVRYSPTDLLYFDVGYRRTNSHLPNYRSALTSADGERIKQQGVELSTRWVVTGYSSFDGRVGWSQEHYTMDEQRNFNGVTGRINWNYTPSGKISYSVALDRDTNNSGGGTTLAGFSFSEGPILGLNSQRRVSTGLLLKTTYSATAKISLTASGNYRRIEEERSLVTESASNPNVRGTVRGDQATGIYRSFSIGANYQLFRSTRLGCSWEKYDRSESLFSREFNGDTINCNAVFVID